MEIAVYINEESLNGQLCDCLSDAINNLMIVINTLASNHSVDVSVITSSAIFSKKICARTGFTMAQLNRTDHDMFMAFKGLLDKGKYWDKDVPAQRPGSLYLYKKQSVNGTSVAEARESLEKGIETILVSVPEKDYIGKTLDVSKDGIGKDVPHALTTADVFDYLTVKGISLKYDRSKFVRVDDMQTILSDTSLFAETHHKVQGRTVYERKGKGEYWYVDNFHKDGSVHLEVFRMSDGSFLGTCDIEDVHLFKAASQREKAGKDPLRF